MSSEASAMAEERKKARELAAFSGAREKIKEKADEFQSDADAQLAQLRKRTVDGFKDL
jgi:hypothetical protein